MSYSQYIIIGLLDFLLGLAVFIVNPRKKRNLFYFLFSASIAAWTASFYLIFHSSNHLLAGRITVLAGLFIPLTFYYFVKYFLDENSPGLFLELLYFIPILAVLLISLPFDFYVKSVEVVNNEILFQPGAIYSLNGLFLLFTVIFSIFLLIRKFFKADSLMKYQLSILFWGAVFALLCGIAFNYILPLMGHSEFNVLGNASTVVLLSFYSFAILKFRLMDIVIIVNRSLAYAMVALVFWLLSVFGLFFVPQYFKLLYIPYIQIFLVLVMVLIIGETFKLLRIFLQNTAEKVLIKGWYDSDKILADVAAELAPIFDTHGILNLLKRQFSEELEIEILNLFQIQNDGATKQYVYHSDQSQTLQSSHPLILAIDQKHETIRISDLPEDARKSIDDMTFRKGRIIFPLLSSSQLVGFFILGSKATGDAYDMKDIALFRTLINQIIPVFDRTLPYEHIKKDFDANQKKLYDKKLYDTERLLARSEKIASMANLIQEYNHEIRTPLGIMRLEVVNNLPDDLADKTGLKKLKHSLLQEIDRAADIVETTLRLTKPKERKEVDLNLNDIIEESIKLYQPVGVELIKEFNSLPLIKGDPEDLRLVFVNLIKNAREAIPETGIIRIKTYSSVEDGETLVNAEVNDNGVGIPKENFERIFEPFFSTHITKGRGLGLSIVFRIIREHLGKIEVESKVGVGSTFKVQLPSVKSTILP